MSKSGVPLVFLDCKSKIENDVTEATLFTGVIAAIQAALETMAVGDPTYFTSSDNEVFLDASKNYALALIKDKEDQYSQEQIYEIIAEISKKINEQFPQINEQFAGINPIQKDTIEFIILSIIERWDDKTAESSASKVLRDSLW